MLFPPSFILLNIQYFQMANHRSDGRETGWVGGRVQLSSPKKFCLEFPKFEYVPLRFEIPDFIREGRGFQWRLHRKFTTCPQLYIDYRPFIPLIKNTTKYINQFCVAM